MMSRVKICGITNIEDAKVASASGVDAIGIVFFKSSPRAVMDLALAREIAIAVGPFVNVVGLFVDAEVEYVTKVLACVPLSCLQFHGNETKEYCDQFNRPYIKALRMKPGVDIKQLADRYDSASGILLDAYVKGLPGGTGSTFDWASIPTLGKPLILAGGLNPENAAKAATEVKPYALDVSGGVESAPGRKNHKKIQSFIQNAKLYTKF
jgi:phosphoribosylanthranilate isomerase